MNCKYFTFRTTKGIKYAYCRFCKIKIDYSNCSHCRDKEYKKYKKMKGKKHERTKKTDIQKGVKQVVWERDNYECIFCNTKVPLLNANAHLIPRSQGGLGIEQNIFTACDKCHSEQENGLNTEKYEHEAEIYLRSKYPNWNKKNLIFKKYKF